jgi:hypothetical protein
MTAVGREAIGIFYAVPLGNTISSQPNRRPAAAWIVVESQTRWPSKPNRGRHPAGRQPYAHGRSTVGLQARDFDRLENLQLPASGLRAVSG